MATDRSPDDPSPFRAGTRVLELFAGIGGLSAASPAARIVAAVEIDRTANAVYRLNHPHPVATAEIAALPPAWFAERQADVWWMSPPCTPFTRRGQQRDLADPRNRALLHLIDVVQTVRPESIVLENVVGFEASQTFQRIEQAWSGAGYRIAWRQLCPSMLGWPNRRPRIYLLASLQDLPGWQPLSGSTMSLRQLLGPLEPPGEERVALRLAPDLASQYLHALDRVDPDDPEAVTACFTRAYGRSIVRSGSYLMETGGGESLRRFSPREVAVLLGFPDTFRWPAGMPRERQWQLLGNSLSLPAVRYVLQHCPGC